MPQIDYPIHGIALSVQDIALKMLYSSYNLGRLVNNQQRYEETQERYTMYDMFTDVRQAICTELFSTQSVNSFRRQLQLLHLNMIVAIYLSNPASYPFAARTLAANDLDVLEQAAKRSARSSSIDGMTRAHLKEVLRQISAAKGAKRDFATFRKQ